MKLTQSVMSGTWRLMVIWTLSVLHLVVTDVSAATTRSETEARENPHLWEPAVKSVAVFKNGFGFFVREGDVSLRDGWCVAHQVPPAAFGTLAIYGHDKEHAVDLVGSGPGEIVDFDYTDESGDLATKKSRLESARPLNVQLTHAHNGEKRQTAGRLVSVEDRFAILDTENHSVAVPLDAISRMQILDLPTRVHVENAEGTSPERTTLGMAYLQKGITWIPDYTVKVIDDTTAEVTLRGTLVNEAEDLIHCDVHLVVGVPHFLHSDRLAPIAVGQMIRTIGAAVAPHGIHSQIMNRSAMVQSVRSAESSGVVDMLALEGGDVAGTLGNLPQMSGPAATDYTAYTKKDLTLRRGEKAIITLFTKRVKYSHVYRWEIPGKLGHYLVLHNETDSAWTTGPFIAVSGQRPLSEDLLKYTPRGGTCELSVTDAVNISHEKSEEEIARELKAHSPRTHNYLDLVTLKGTLKLRNYEKRTARIIVTTPVPGKPTEAGDGGKTQMDSTRLQLSDRLGSITWEITCEPGERKTVTYQYERYVPSS